MPLITSSGIRNIRFGYCKKYTKLFLIDFESFFRGSEKRTSQPFSHRKLFPPLYGKGRTENKELSSQSALPLISTGMDETLTTGPGLIESGIGTLNLHVSFRFNNLIIPMPLTLMDTDIIVSTLTQYCFR
jgi:hypothetical protein